MEAQAENLKDIPDGMAPPIWLVKFKNWKTLKASCEAAVGPGGIYCLWIGRNCAYQSCPRRIFEEVGVDLTKVPPPREAPKLKKQIQAQAQQIKQLQDKIVELEKKIEVSA
jgi:hypothetical protein